MNNHPTYLTIHKTWPNLSHSGRGWCARCRGECVLLDDTEKYAPEVFPFMEEDFDDE